MSIATSLAPTIKKTIDDFGSSGVFKREEDGEYDPATGTTSSVLTETPIKLIPETYKAEEITGQVQAGDLKMMVILDDITPTLDDKVTFYNVDYSVLNIEPMIFQDVILYHTLQVRV